MPKRAMPATLAGLAWASSSAINSAALKLFVMRGTLLLGFRQLLARGTHHAQKAARQLADAVRMAVLDRLRRNQLAANAQRRRAREDEFDGRGLLDAAGCDESDVRKRPRQGVNILWARRPARTGKS